MDNDGGAAFPISRAHFTEDGRLLSSDWLPGMSLRDWFAGQATVGDTKFPDIETMAEYVGETNTPREDDWLALLAMSHRAMAKLRYDQADAMLAEREARR